MICISSPFKLQRMYAKVQQATLSSPNSFHNATMLAKFSEELYALQVKREAELVAKGSYKAFYYECRCRTKDRNLRIPSFIDHSGFQVLALLSKANAFSQYLSSVYSTFSCIVPDTDLSTSAHIQFDVIDADRILKAIKQLKY